MNKLLIKKISYVVLFCFMFLLIGDTYPLNAASERDGVALIEKGEAEYSDGFYREALDSFNRAIGMVEKDKNKKRLYLDLSLVHYALGDTEKCQETLRSLLGLDPEMEIDPEEFPKGFLQVIDKVNAQVQQEIAEQKKIEEQKRLEDLKKALEMKKAEEEEKRQKEIRRQEELMRMEEIRKAEEQKRIEELGKVAAAKKAEDERKRQEELKKIEKLKQIEAARKAEEQRKLEELRKAEEENKKKEILEKVALLKKAEEEKKRLEEQQRIEEQKRLDELKKIEELKKQEALRKAEEEKKHKEELEKAEALKKAEEDKKQKEEARILEEQKKQEELHQAQEIIKFEEQKKDEELKKAEEQKKLDEQKKIDELNKAAETLRLENEKKAQEKPKIIIEQAKKEKTPATKKKKKFPWLVAGLGAVVVVGLLVLLRKKKNESPSENNSLIVISPNGGESLQIGTKYNITWSLNGSFTSVKIEYSTNNGTAWTVVTGSTTANNCSYAWTVPNTPSASCLVRVSNAADAGVNDSSNGVFTITTNTGANSLTVISPNSGEIWQVGTSHSITWVSTGSIANVKIEYSSNNGSTWIVVSNSTTNNGSYAWTVPNTPSASCLVRISDATNTNVNDRSNSVFTISTTAPTASITVTSPNGGEIWQVGTSHSITWTSTGSIANVRIEYSSNNGSMWTIVIGSTANNGSYLWTVPNTPSASCLMRIFDIDHPGVNDVSNGFFSITSSPSSDSITIITPNGGESWQVLSNHSITWSSTGSIANVSIEYSTDDGGSWNFITSSTANTGSYSWSIPNLPSTTCLVRIRDASNASVSDRSDSVFTIAASIPSISISISPTSKTLTPGSSGTFDVTVIRSGSYTGSVSLTLMTTLPAGVTASYSHPGTGNTGQITLNVATSCQLVTNYEIRVQAYGSGVSSAYSSFQITISH